MDEAENLPLQIKNLREQVALLTKQQESYVSMLSGMTVAAMSHEKIVAQLLSDLARADRRAEWKAGIEVRALQAQITSLAEDCQHKDTHIAELKQQVDTLGTENAEMQKREDTLVRRLGDPVGWNTMLGERTTAIKALLDIHASFPDKHRIDPKAFEPWRTVDIEAAGEIIIRDVLDLYEAIDCLAETRVVRIPPSEMMHGRQISTDCTGFYLPKEEMDAMCKRWDDLDARDRTLQLFVSRTSSKVPTLYNSVASLEMTQGEVDDIIRTRREIIAAARTAALFIPFAQPVTEAPAPVENAAPVEPKVGT